MKRIGFNPLYIICLLSIFYLNCAPPKLYDGPPQSMMKECILETGNSFHLKDVDNVPVKKHGLWGNKYVLLPGEHRIHFVGVTSESVYQKIIVEGDFVIFVNMKAGHRYWISYIFAGTDYSEGGDKIIPYIEEDGTKKRFTP